MVLKQVAGVDIAQNELVVTLSRIDSEFKTENYQHKVFKNTELGFSTFLLWLKKYTDEKVDIRVVMEATGNYHQKFAYFLVDKSYQVSIVLPNKISNFKRILDLKTITDKSMSEAIAMFGLSRKLDNWKKPKSEYRTIQQLSRERNQIVDERSQVKNQLHAEMLEAFPNQKSIQTLESRIVFLNGQESEIKQELEEVVVKDKKIQKDMENISSIPGVGRTTALAILGETNGFELIRNKRQLVSYAGLDVVEKTSGTSVKHKTRISKKGNVHIRKAIYYPALSAIKNSECHKEFYKRIVSKDGVKMKGVIAVCRKLLELIYVLYKSDKKFEIDYEKNRAEDKKVLSPVAS